MKHLINTVLILFILVSIPVTVFIARRANLGSSASALGLSLNVKPNSQEIVSGGSRSFELDLTIPEANIKSQKPVLLKFTGLPEGVTLDPQPLGATPSNYFQKNHIFNVVVSPKTAVGKYSVTVVASDMSLQQKTTFSFTVK